MTSRDAESGTGAARRSLAAALWRWRWTIGFGAALVAGTVFRLVWLTDMEYKGDEAWTVDHVQAFWATRHFPLFGMGSHAGLPNAGMSLWVFLGLGALAPLRDPLAMARAVEVINIVAIALLALFAAKDVGRAEREPWLWSVALVAVNPLAVLFSRKIWPPDIIPIFTLAMLAAWWHRKRWWGAFAWGLVGALLGQIQLCGFFFAAAFFLATLVGDRRNVRWRGWLAGSILGALPLLPWAVAILGGHPSVLAFDPLNLIQPYFYQHWLSIGLGLDLHYALGNDFLPFLATPAIAGVPTYLSGAFLGLVVACFATILLRFIAALRTNPVRVSALVFAPGSSTALALNAAFWGYGLLLMLSAEPIFLHYLVVAFCLPTLWIAWLDRAATPAEEGTPANSRPLMASLALAQACVTVLFLTYIHDTKIIAGDYGTVYRLQTHQSAPPP